MLQMTQTEFAKLGTKYTKNKGIKAVSKHKNKKIYVYKNNISFEKKDEGKYGKPIMCFDSRKEHSRWESLKLIERGGGSRYLQKPSR